MSLAIAAVLWPLPGAYAAERMPALYKMDKYASEAMCSGAVHADDYITSGVKHEEMFGQAHEMMTAFYLVEEASKRPFAVVWGSFNEVGEELAWVAWIDLNRDGNADEKFDSFDVLIEKYPSPCMLAALAQGTK